MSSSRTISNSRDAKRKRHSSKKRRGLNINLSATPIKSLTKNTRKARSKPTLNTRDITKNLNNNQIYNFVITNDKKNKSSNRINARYRKRISAPIILPKSTTPSANLEYISKNNTPNTPYYSNNNHKHKNKNKNKYKQDSNTNTNFQETIIEKPSLYESHKNNINYSRKSITHSTCSGALSYDDEDDESDEYLDEKEINEMIRSCRRISKSRPRAYSKTRRVSQKLFGLMESISLDDDYDNNDDDEKMSIPETNLTFENVYDDDDEEYNDYSDDDDDDDNDNYHKTLKKYGYIEKRVIAKSLQGVVIEANKINIEKEKDSDSVIIKITNKKLHFNKISNKHGKSLSVQEDIIKEKKLLMYLTANNPPSSLVKFLGFFSDKYNYFLVMENGGNDFFDWIVKCHKWIRAGKLSLKQWNLYIHDLMLQIIKFLKWLHYKMNVCHLDISLENMLIKNNKYKSDGNGGIRLSRKMQIKFCDFGLAEYFSEKNKLFLCKKYVGKTHYKAPKVYEKKLLFDARKADIWSLGVSFFMMIIGAPPYKLPIDTDDHFPLIKQNNINAILKRWGRDHYINKNTQLLLNQMLQIDEKKRITIYQMQHHPYFNSNNNNNHHIIKKRRSTHDIMIIKQTKRKRKPSNPIHSNIMATYHNNNDILMENDINNNNKSKSSIEDSDDSLSLSIIHKKHNNIFQNLVMSEDDGQLFRYRKRKLTST